MGLDIYKIKAKYLLPPFLKITFYTIFGFAVFRYFFNILFNIIEINEEKWEIWLPALLPIIPIFLWLNPKLNILRYKSTRSDGILTIITYFTIMPMGIILQNYITEATSELLNLNTIQEIAQHDKVRYYYIHNYAVDTTKIHSYIGIVDSKSGKKNASVDMYIVVPFKAAAKNAASPKYWYGIHFNQYITGALSDKAKWEVRQKFQRECNRDMPNYNYYALDHFERVPKSVDREKFLSAVKQQTKVNDDKDNIILKPIFEPYQNRYKVKLIWVAYIFVVGLALYMLFLTFPRYSEGIHKRQPSNQMYINRIKKIFYIK